MYDRQIIYIKDFTTVGSDVVSAEYFIDTDPGIGNGTAFSISTSSQMIMFDTDGLADGDHLFYVRVLNEDGDWSFYDSAVFTIDSALNVQESLFKSTNIYPNPFVDKINIDIVNKPAIQEVEIYNSNGKTIFSSFEDKKEVNLPWLSSGIYLLKIKTNDKEATFKIIKE